MAHKKFKFEIPSYNQINITSYEALKSNFNRLEDDVEKVLFLTAFTLRRLKPVQFNFLSEFSNDRNSLIHHFDNNYSYSNFDYIPSSIFYKDYKIPLIPFTKEPYNFYPTYKAIATALIAHKDQYRKYTKEPYINHCTEAFELFNSFYLRIYDPSIFRGGPHHKHHLDELQTVYCICFLHDVLEDTSITFQDLVHEFSFNIAMGVHWLSDTSKPEDGNRLLRKRIDNERFRGAPLEAIYVKVVDSLSNLKDISEHDPEFAKVYIKEKKELLKILIEITTTTNNSFAKTLVNRLDEEISNQSLRLKEINLKKSQLTNL